MGAAPQRHTHSAAKQIQPCRASHHRCDPNIPEPRRTFDRSRPRSHQNRRRRVSILPTPPEPPRLGVMRALPDTHSPRGSASRVQSLPPSQIQALLTPCCVVAMHVVRATPPKMHPLARQLARAGRSPRAQATCDRSFMHTPDMHRTTSRALPSQPRHGGMQSALAAAASATSTTLRHCTAPVCSDAPQHSGMQSDAFVRGV